MCFCWGWDFELKNDYPLVNQHSNGISPCLIGNTSSKGPFSIIYYLSLPECSSGSRAPRNSDVLYITMKKRDRVILLMDPVNSGTNYLAQLVSRISEPSTEGVP